MSNRSVIVFVSLLAAGLLYRIFMSSFTYREIRWDVQSYGSLAKGMMENPFFVDCCQKAAGYPGFLTAVYSLFGIENLTAVAGIQCILDLFSAIIVYGTARRFFPKNAAALVFVLYIFHPFAVSYIGFQLPETITIFLLVSMMWVVSHQQFPTRPGLWLFFGVLLGLMLWVRLSFYYFIFLAPGMLTILLFRERKRILFLTVAIVGFLLASVHSVVSYQVTFGRWSLVPPYTMGMPAALYMSFFMGRYPELISQYNSLDKQYYDINLEYNTTSYLQNKAFREKYSELFYEKLATGWAQLVGNSLRNVVWMWDVNHLFVYEDPWYPADQLPVRILNLTGIFLCAVGMMRYAIGKGKAWIRDPALVFTILVFGYVTVLFAPITNETRYVIPLYPFILLWAGYALYDYYPLRRS